jgi:hypothetical protein
LNQRQAPVDDARKLDGFGSCDSERVSQDDVANASSKNCKVGGDVHGGCSAGELRLGRLCARAGGCDDRSAVGLDAAHGRIGGHVRRGDGRCHVDDGGGRSAGHGDSVDAVNSRGDVDSGVVRVLLSESGYEEREEEDNDLLEGAHLDGGSNWLLRRGVCCYATCGDA